ncbi:MAG: IS5 family transposase [Reyranellales bacterium]
MGRSRGGLSTKINALVDGSGLPRRIVLSAGQAHDGSAVPELLRDLPPDGDVVADRGYDSNATLELIRQAGLRAHIPTPCRRKVQRSVDPAIYRQRNLIERFFNKLKHFRRIATRFDKLARNYLAAVLLASTRLWMRAYESTT